MNMLTDSHDAVTADWAAALLDFWFNQVGEEGWYSHDPALDQHCIDRFAVLWSEKRTLPPESFLDRADDALAAVLLFDQLPRNMFRGQAQAFATDSIAREAARGAIALGYDIQIGGRAGSSSTCRSSIARIWPIRSCRSPCSKGPATPGRSISPASIMQPSRASAVSPIATLPSVAPPCPPKRQRSPKDRNGRREHAYFLGMTVHLHIFSAAQQSPLVEIPR